VPRDRRAGRLGGGLPRWAALPAAAALIAVVALASRSASAPPLSVAFDTSPLTGALQVAGYLAELTSPATSVAICAGGSLLAITVVALRWPRAALREAVDLAYNS